MVNMDEIKNAVDLLLKAGRVSALTGAGMSAESGIQTFRDKDGVWTKMDPMKWATREGYLENPKLVWEWYEARRNQVKNSKPNDGHCAMAEFENIFGHFSVATQNIDGFHKLSGSKNAYELHGNIFRNKCFDEDKILEELDETSIPPRCPYCGSLARPDVVWFGEILPQEVWEAAFDDAKNSDVYMVVGTSGAVYPAAGLAGIAKKNGAKVIIVNPEDSEIDLLADVLIKGKSGEVLPEILRGLQASK